MPRGRRKTEDPGKLDQLVAVAVMKHKMGYSQASIAGVLGVSAMTISRMLDEAVDRGIVKISVRTPIESDEDLSEEIKERYGLMDAFVAKTSHYENMEQGVAKATAYYLDHSICPGDILGIAAGRTLSRVMPHMTLPLIGTNRDRFEVVQLQGGYTAMGDRNPTISIINFANRFGVRGHLLQHSMYASSAELAGIIREHDMDALEALWARCTILVCGIGIWGPQCIQREEKLLREEDFRELDAAGAVGDLFGRWFDARGQYIDCSCNRRVMSITPCVQERVPRKILVSSKPEKAEAIRVLLANRMMNILVADEETARYLVRTRT